MNAHEEGLLTFFLKAIQPRYRFLLSQPKRRSEGTNRLNHCKDLDPAYITWLARDPRGSSARNAELATLLLQKGGTKEVYVLSCSSTIDSQMLPLELALRKTEAEGWGTLISCLTGKLAYYFDEAGERRAILERK
ncbi:MAG: hypothetical protein ACRCYY_12580 [Trueperaceae bacterium]